MLKCSKQLLLVTLMTLIPLCNAQSIGTRINKPMAQSAVAEPKKPSPHWAFEVKPEHHAFRVSFRARSKDVVQGELGWQTARVDVRITNSKQKDVAWMFRHNFLGTKNWHYFDDFYVIPETTVRVSAFPAQFGASGSFEIHDMDFIAYTKEDMKKLEQHILASKDNLLVTAPLKSLDKNLATVTYNQDGLPTITLLQPDSGVNLTVPIPQSLRQPRTLQPGYAVELSCKLRTQDGARAKVSLINCSPLADRAITQHKNVVSTDDAPEQDVILTTTLYDDNPSIAFALLNTEKSGTVRCSDIRMKVIKESRDAPLPKEAAESREQLFDLSDAWKVSTPTREKICLNGLWRFLPLFSKENVQNHLNSNLGWGWFKVPASWPDYKRPWEYTHSFILPGWVINHLKSKADSILHDAWYERDILIPETWTGKRCIVDFEMFQGKGIVYVDGKSIVPIAFPGGPIDITSAVTPGKKHKLQVYITTEPRETSVFMGMTREYKSVTEYRNKGICGDVFLCAVPMKHEISDVRIVTSVNNMRIDLDTGFNRLPKGNYSLKATITKNGKVAKTLESKQFSHDGSSDFRFTFGDEWTNPELWDTDRPGNIYTLSLSLYDQNNALLDTFTPETFGFREFEIRGRDFYLNGTRIHLRALPINHTALPSASTKNIVEHLVKVAKQLNINFLFDGDRAYNYRIGTNSYDRHFREMLSENGILMSLAMAHAVTDFKSKLNDPEIAKAYRKLCEYRIRRFQNLPGIVMYAANHNALGHADMQNPISMGTDWRPKGDTIPTSRRYNGLLSEKIIASIDPTRPVYHHDAGNLGRISAQNFYLNWVPMQERSDWMEPWSKKGTMPIIFVEYGIPHIASWSSFRGPGFIWRVLGVQGTWLNEYNAETLGEKVYTLNEQKADLFRLEYRIAQNNTPTRYITGGKVVAQKDSDELRSLWLWNNLRDMRAHGISGFQPWDGSSIFVLKQRNNWLPEYPNRFKNLKRPGSIPDRQLFNYNYLTNPLDTFELNLTGEALLRGYLPMLAWISGKPGDFTERSRHFNPGETVNKALTVLNDTRRPQSVSYTWSVPELGITNNGTSDISVGGRVDLPISFVIPKDCKEKSLTIEATFSFSDGSKPQKDTFTLDVIAPAKPLLKSRVALWDPEKSAAPLLDALNVAYKHIEQEDDLKGMDMLVIGRFGLNRMPFNLTPHLANGLRMLVLEQTPDLLNQLELRFATQGLRTLFPLPGQNLPELRDWRGSSTTRPYFPPGQEVNSSYPKSLWNGFMNTHIWYLGQRGNVADILLEKPSVGNWLPFYHGGFDLQYAPLILFREQKAKIMMCQLNVSARTETEPQALNALAHALVTLEQAQTPETRPVFVSGKNATELLGKLAVHATAIPKTLPQNALLVIESGEKLPANLEKLIADGANVLALGWNKKEIDRFAPKAKATEGVYFTDYAHNLGKHPEYAGISNSDVYIRYEEPFASFPVDSDGGRLLHVRKIGKGNIVFYQLPPYLFNQTELIKRTTIRRSQFTTSRLLANLGAASTTNFFSFFKNVASMPTEISLAGTWKGIEDPKNTGREKGFFKPTYDATAWRNVEVPGNFDSQFPELEKYDGYFWYRLDFELTEAMVAHDLIINIGPVDDESWTWLDGKFLGEITKKTHPDSYWVAPRRYEFPANTLKPGKHTIVVLCNDTYLKGGITRNPIITHRLKFSLYADILDPQDDPYRYFHW